jgi:hypothetical protein
LIFSITINKMTFKFMFTEPGCQDVSHYNIWACVKKAEINEMLLSLRDSSDMGEFIKSAVKFPLKNCLRFAKLFSSVGDYFIGEQGSGMPFANIQEDVNGVDNVYF